MQIASGLNATPSVLTVFARNTYKRFSELSPEELDQDKKLLGKVITERVEIKSFIKEGGLVIQAQTFRKSPKVFESEVFPALEKYQALRLQKNGQEELLEELPAQIEAITEYVMSLTVLPCEDFGYQYLKSLL